MLVTFFITIVFIAELIIVVSALLNLRRLSRAVCELNEIVEASKSVIKEVSVLVRKISEQVLEFSNRFVEKFRTDRDDFIIKSVLKLILSGMVLKHLKKSKTGKIFARGLSILGIVV